MHISRSCPGLELDEMRILPHEWMILRPVVDENLPSLVLHMISFCTDMQKASFVFFPRIDRRWPCLNEYLFAISFKKVDFQLCSVISCLDKQVLNITDFELIAGL